MCTNRSAAIRSPWYGAGRPKWLGPLGDTYQYPAYLNGTVAGDYGFDPLGFSAEPAAFARNYECEVSATHLIQTFWRSLRPQWWRRTGVEAIR
jgi:hypothetical protein